ncbi:MAG: sulfotransferase family 2 domain-containing protein [Alphaproteobacteria bacterium]|nr:sulfotransferase family 2 domain-containing protein [Alphaproteobacteria bacterium]
MIPKNACSTMRLSIALANGAIGDAEDWRWIHRNNKTFRPSLRELATVDYCFTFLRCPYSRLVSCFLDKIVSRRPDAWHFHELTGEIVDLPRLTFRRFCQEMMRPQIKHNNIHWRPQVDFLVYKTYDDLFSVEDFATASAALRDKIGLEIIDSRPMVRHDSSHYKLLPASKSFADTEIWQIEAIMLNGMRPNPVSFYDDELRSVVALAFAEDLKLYRCLFDGFGLFDAPKDKLEATA